MTFRGRTVSRVELARRSNQLARRLQALGVRAGDMVTIGLPNGVEFFEATLATWKLGAVPQPVPYRLPFAGVAGPYRSGEPQGRDRPRPRRRSRLAARR